MICVYIYLGLGWLPSIFYAECFFPCTALASQVWSSDKVQPY